VAILLSGDFEKSIVEIDLGDHRRIFGAGATDHGRPRPCILPGSTLRSLRWLGIVATGQIRNDIVHQVRTWQTGRDWMKTVGLMPKRPDISRADFRDHYENRHAPLALGKFPFEKYVRNHVVKSDPDPVGFDCLSEFWVSDVAEVQRIMAGEVGDIMREDERRFTDQPKIGPAVAQEFHVFGPAREVEDGIVRKEILLLRRAPGVSMDVFITAATAWGKDLASMSEGRLTRVLFDSLTPFDGRYFPRCDGVLYGWIDDEGDALFNAEPPAEIEIHGRIKTETVETRL
jgi:uncharacterized protein (TIGR02118 family)